MALLMLPMVSCVVSKLNLAATQVANRFPQIRGLHFHIVEHNGRVYSPPAPQSIRNQTIIEFESCAHLSGLLNLHAESPAPSNTAAIRPSTSHLHPTHSLFITRPHHPLPIYNDIQTSPQHPHLLPQHNTASAEIKEKRTTRVFLVRNVT